MAIRSSSLVGDIRPSLSAVRHHWCDGFCWAGKLNPVIAQPTNQQAYCCMISARDRTAAVNFYRCLFPEASVMGLEAATFFNLQWEMFGITDQIGERSNIPKLATDTATLQLSVVNCDDVLARLSVLGVKILKSNPKGLNPTSVLFEDPEGNVIELLSRKWSQAPPTSPERA